MKGIAIILLVLQVMFSDNVFAQDNKQQDWMEKYKITTIEAMIMKNDDVQDSFMITKEYFNVRGYRTKIEVFGFDGPKCYYEYYYAGDTLKTHRNTYSEGGFVSVSKHRYDENNLLISTIDYDANGKETNTYKVREYNKKKQLKKVYITINGKRWMRQSLNYRSNGNLRSVYNRYAGRPKTVVRYHINGAKIRPENINLIEETYDKTTGLDRKSITRIIKQEETTIAGGGQTKFKIGDEITSETYTEERGLVMQEIQYINGSLSAIKKYLYQSNTYEMMKH